MALRIVDHYPDINAVSIYRNIYIKAHFNKGLVPQSVTYSHFSVHDTETYSTVPGELGVEYDSSGNAIYAVFQPTINLTANTKYRAYLYGKPNSVIAAYTQEQLDDSYSWEFTTGTGILEGQMPAGIPSGALPASGVTSSGTAISYSGIYNFTVLSTTPQHQQPNVATKLSGIYIEFNTEVASSLSELSGAISITETCVLN